MPEIRKYPVECVTMGHQGCTRSVEKKPGDDRFRTFRIDHYVYGVHHVEMKD